MHTKNNGCAISGSFEPFVVFVHKCLTFSFIETGESWCGIVKHLQSITNHHNANRDTAMKLAHIEEICHIIDNGTWKSNGIRYRFTYFV